MLPPCPRNIQRQLQREGENVLGQSVPLGCEAPGTGPNTSCQEPTKRRGGAGGREGVRIEVSELPDPESLGIRIWCVGGGLGGWGGRGGGETVGGDENSPWILENSTDAHLPWMA